MMLRKTEPSRPLTFSTKAETLAKLEGQLSVGKVLPQYCFTVSEFSANRAEVLSTISQKFKGRVIIRSSSLSEDSLNESKAGQFLSLLDVDSQNCTQEVEAVIRAFDEVVDGNQVLVQPMLTEIVMCGVLFSIDPNTGGNYYVLNYDLSSASDAVTSGKKAELMTEYVFHGKKPQTENVQRLINATQEIMELFAHSSVDIEFAFTSNGDLYILQVRPLILSLPVADKALQQATLDRVYRFIGKEMQPKPYAKGKRTVYGVMPDWNPAEMIGTRPKPLAMSLYKKLITDGTWAYQRNDYGYRNLRSFPLMLDFAGMGYIDTRVSFNSFIPADIDEALADKLADYYVDSLAKEPDKHDKVEFDIVLSCYTFDIEKKLEQLRAHGFSEDEQNQLSQSLRDLTNKVIDEKTGLWIIDKNKIEKLKERYDIIAASDFDTLDQIYWLLEDCTRYGTLPFAGLARAGFISVLLLKSFVTTGILSEQEYDNYMGSLNTVSSQMSRDKAQMSKQAFMRKYGHLRPGTYDITSFRYDALPERYFSDLGQEGEFVAHESNIFSLSLEQYAAIQEQMKTHGIEGNVLSLFDFIKAGIEGREYAKFVFTKSLSLALEKIAHWGKSLGFSREDMAYTDITSIYKLYSSTLDEKSLLEQSIEAGKAKYAQTLTLTLPPVIINPDDIYAFKLFEGTPNYITLKSFTGYICDDKAASLENKIVMIPAADPGYDWIFSHKIGGLITAYGGANSHMAIRSGELGIPAIIGAGEKLFETWGKANVLKIDCAGKTVEVMS